MMGKILHENLNVSDAASGFDGVDKKLSNRLGCRHRDIYLRSTSLRVTL
jgi:hypothetical protein